METENLFIEILVQFTSGSIAGAISNCISYPFTNLRLRRISENFAYLEGQKNHNRIIESPNSDCKNNIEIGKINTQSVSNNIIDEHLEKVSKSNNLYSDIKISHRKSEDKNQDRTLNESESKINEDKRAHNLISENFIHGNIPSNNVNNLIFQNGKNKNSEYNLDLNVKNENNKINKEEQNPNEINGNDLIKQIFFKIYENIDIFKYCFDIIQSEGVGVLFDGMSSSVFGAIVQNGVYFCSVKIFYSFLKRINLKFNNRILNSMLVNLLSAICTAIFTNPIWVLNIRMAKKSKEDKHLGNFAMVKKILTQEGFGGFYKGIIPSLILTLNPVILFTTYEVLRKSFIDIKGNISNKHILLISLISKMITILINYPLMTIKSIYQANSHLSSDEVWVLLMKMIKEETIVGLYKGLSSKLIGSLISNTVLMFTYEKIQKFAKIILSEMILGISPKIKV